MLVVVRVRGCDVDDVDVWVGDERAVGAVRCCGGGGAELVEEVCGAGLRGGGCGGGDEVVDVACGSCGGVDEEVFGEGLEGVRWEGWWEGEGGMYFLLCRRLLGVVC